MNDLPRLIVLLVKIAHKDRLRVGSTVGRVNCIGYIDWRGVRIGLLQPASHQTTRKASSPDSPESADRPGDGTVHEISTVDLEEIAFDRKVEQSGPRAVSTQRQLPTPAFYHWS